MNIKASFSRFLSRIRVGEGEPSPSFTAAPEGFTAEKLDALEQQQQSEPTVPDISDIDESLIKAAQAAGIKVEGVEEDEDGDKGPSGPTGAEEEEEGGEGASGPTSATGPEGASGPASAPEGASGPAGDLPAASGVTGPENVERDKDLEKPLNPNTHPKTKQVISEFKSKVVEARNEVETLKKQVEELKKNGGGAIPEATKKELEDLRTRLREFDINADPVIQEKYDKKITSNVDNVLSILKSHGYGLDKDGKEIPGAIEKLKASGVNLKTVGALVKSLEADGKYEDAEAIKDALKENAKLSKDKEVEVADVKKNFEARQATQTEEQKKSVEEYSKTLIKEADVVIRSHVSKFAQLQRPPAPLATDAPAVRKAKEDAVNAYNTEMGEFQKNLGAAWKDNMSMSLASAEGVLMKHHLVPKLTKELESASARIKALEADLGKVRKAGSTARVMSTAKPSDTKPKDYQEESSDDGVDAITAAAKSLGINVGS